MNFHGFAIGDKKFVISFVPSYNRTTVQRKSYVLGLSIVITNFKSMLVWHDSLPPWLYMVSIRSSIFFLIK